jgi:hypothetical protein
MNFALAKLRGPEHYVLSSEFYEYCLALRLALQRVCAAPYQRLDLGGACGDAALIICGHLRKKNIPNEFVEGTFRHGKTSGEHCWSRAVIGRSKHVIDVTATQFGRDIPPVILLPEAQASRLYGYRTAYVNRRVPPEERQLTPSQMDRVRRRALRLRAEP